MALYEKLSRIDILRPLLPGFAEKRFRMLWNGKIAWSSRAYVEPNTPWVFAEICPMRNCNKWLDIYHGYYKIIPRGCRNCWKVAYRPKSVTELMRVYKLQVEMGKPAKCGIETRSLTGARGGYGSFWYVPLDGGLKKARSLYELVEAKLGMLLMEYCHKTDIAKRMVLKRGCTEMEQHTVNLGLGGSDTWDKGAENFDMVEDLLDETFLKTKINRVRQPEIMRIHTERMWIEWAFEHGDETYLEFVEKGSFPSKPVDYGRSDHLEKDFRATNHKRN